MNKTISVKGRQLVIREVEPSEEGIIKYDVFDGDTSITSGLGFTAPSEFMRVVDDWIALIKQEVARRVSGE